MHDDDTIRLEYWSDCSQACLAMVAAALLFTIALALRVWCEWSFATALIATAGAIGALLWCAEPTRSRPVPLSGGSPFERWAARENERDARRRHAWDLQCHDKRWRTCISTLSGIGIAAMLSGVTHAFAPPMVGLLQDVGAGAFTAVGIVALLRMTRTSYPWWTVAVVATASLAACAAPFDVTWLTLSPIACAVAVVTISAAAAPRRTA